MNQAERDTVTQNDESASMSDMLEQSYANPMRGDVRKGVILSVRPDEIVVDVGAKQDAIVASRELANLTPEERAALHVGDSIYVYLIRADDRDDTLIVSLKLAREYEEWQHAQEYMDSGEIIKAKVVGFNKGGLVCAFGSLQGFVPASQIANLDQRVEGGLQGDGLAKLVGEELVLKVIEVNRRRRRLIFSERAARREWRTAQRERLLAELKEGEVRHGTVSGLRDFGAFVDLGGVDGLVHLSELGWSRVRHPSDVLKVGQPVDVMVLNIDREGQRIGLSIKRTQPDPWSLVVSKYQAGQMVKGVVTHLVKFGAFVELEPGIEGLVHISELAEGNVIDPAEVIREGQPLTLVVLDVDSQRQRISLSLRQAPPEEEQTSLPDEAPAENPNEPAEE